MPQNPNARYEAIQLSASRQPRKIKTIKDDLERTIPVSEYFGCNAFGEKQIKRSLSEDDFTEFQQTIKKGKKLEKELANKIAKAVSIWAREHAITHFCHWFQPMTGLTAEKHDAFLDIDVDGQPFEKFSASQLIQSEPDASSFPSGGMRTTFEARGYTAWDPSSPMFMLEGTNGKTLCIPSAFVSYHGHALDEKTPLLRSMEVISKAAVETLQLLGNDKVNHVTTTLGAEQEYFVIDKSFWSLRPDLMLTGRTLLGARPPKGQELEDHYFGSIPDRVSAFMQEMEMELYKVGIPAKTRHNEVAPSQFEIAAIFEDANVSVDHNHIIMETMKRVASRHNLALLLHEKPFDGVNGSGKHNNWSLMSDTGENLLDPGDTPHHNLRFLVMLSAVLKGVHKHNALIRASIASPGNDHRLGANEAPPAIVSVFLGDELTKILDKIKSGEEIENPEHAMISLGMANVAHVAKDNTDRNRTSPFAFTGNKFEFRAVGSSASCSYPMVCLNAAVSEALQELNVELKEKLANSESKEQTVLEVVRKSITESEAVRFEGNNYGEEWLQEAEKRGLAHLRNTSEALEAMEYQSSKDLFSKLNILNVAEQESRVNVYYERYNKKIDIEVEAMKMLVDVYVGPAATKYLGDLAGSVKATKDLGVSVTSQESNVKILSGLINELYAKRENLAKLFAATESLDDKVRAKELASKLLPAMEEIREISDSIECMSGDSYWPLPKYREMLFLS